MKPDSSRVFSIKEQIGNIYFGSKSFVLLKTSRKYRLMNKKLKERIMLAITEVNGCTMCSYIHTKLALSSGMKSEDIKSILGGDTTSIPLEEAVAVMFGQNFAYSKEVPSKESINRLYEEYGEQKAKLVIAVCYMITMTNGMGTSMDYLYSRLRLKKNKKSNILIELLNPLLTMLLFPIFVLLLFPKVTYSNRKLSKQRKLIVE